MKTELGLIVARLKNDNMRLIDNSLLHFGATLCCKLLAQLLAQLLPVLSLNSTANITLVPIIWIKNKVAIMVFLLWVDLTDRIIEKKTHVSQFFIEMQTIHIVNINLLQLCYK